MTSSFVAAGKWKVVALTNNFAKVGADAEGTVPLSELEYLGWQDGVIPSHLTSLFDDFCDSSALGTRKPEPAFYRLACQRNSVQPRECVFLDDIGG